MGYKLVIAEKPMLGRDIARAMCGRKVSETTPLPISGNGYTVVACAGHLLELVEPEHVDRKWGEPWSIDALPILIPDWPKQPAKASWGLSTNGTTFQTMTGHLPLATNVTR